MYFSFYIIFQVYITNSTIQNINLILQNITYILNYLLNLHSKLYNPKYKLV